MDRTRYPANWDEIALKVKRKAKWTCQQCGKKCLKPSHDRSNFTKSEKAKLTLTVHHKNYRPEDNSEENLIALCSGCHLHFHRRGKGSETIGQLNLFAQEIG